MSPFTFLQPARSEFLMKRPILCAALLLWSTGAIAADTPSSRLAAISDRYSQHALDRDISAQVAAGRPAGAVPSRDLTDLQREVALADAMLNELAAIPTVGLTDEEQLTAAMLRWELADKKTPLLGDAYVFPGPYSLFELNFVKPALAANPLATPVDQAAYLDLLGSVAGNLEATRARVERQVARGIYMPRAQVPRAIKALEALRGQMVSYDKPLKPVTVAFAARAAALNSANLAALDALVATLGPPYVAKASDRIGLAQYPGGKDYYRQLVRSYTTTDLSPEALSELGRNGLARNKLELAAVAAKLGIAGGHAGLKHFADTDPGFFVKTPAEVAARYQRCMDRIAPLLPAWFNPLPKAPYAAVRLDPALEPGMTYGYYDQPTPGRPTGEYRFNGANLDKRSQFNSCGIIFHELMPGHHLQIASQLENASLPPFRRNASIVAYSEGWAEYASNLGVEMGAYPDPRDLLGRLMMDAQINSRLVVDVGLNHDGWTMDEARQFLRENTFISETEIESDLFRYGTDIPGQALGYGAGLAEIAALRRDAEKAAGKDFDIKRFHREVVGHGALPMTVLRDHVMKTAGAR